MFDCLRKIVAGPKNRMVTQKYDLDLTYITSRIIAMAFPAQGCQQLYRNRIVDVSNFLNEKHANNYYIINVSGRTYDNEPFGGRVKKYDWLDHMAPTLQTLFQIAAYSAAKLRENMINVIVVHCNHGKGRTGTAIMCTLLFMQETYPTIEAVQQFYNLKRFSKKSYSISQPCQLRYLSFFKRIMDKPSEYHLRVFRLTNIKSQNLTNKHYLRIYKHRTQTLVYNHVRVISFGDKNVEGPLLGDVFIELMEEGVLGDKRLARINYHLSFLEEKEGLFVAQFDGADLANSPCVSQSYKLTLEFSIFCDCHFNPIHNCPCSSQRILEEPRWSNIHKIIRNRWTKTSNFVKTSSSMQSEGGLNSI